MIKVITSVGAFWVVCVLGVGISWRQAAVAVQMGGRPGAEQLAYGLIALGVALVAFGFNCGRIVGRGEDVSR